MDVRAIVIAVLMGSMGCVVDADDQVGEGAAGWSPAIAGDWSIEFSFRPGCELPPRSLTFTVEPVVDGDDGFVTAMSELGECGAWSGPNVGDSALLVCGDLEIAVSDDGDVAAAFVTTLGTTLGGGDCHIRAASATVIERTR